MFAIAIIRTFKYVLNSSVCVWCLSLQRAGDALVVASGLLSYAEEAIVIEGKSYVAEEVKHVDAFNEPRTHKGKKMEERAFDWRSGRAEGPMDYDLIKNIVIGHHDHASMHALIDV